MHHICLAKFLIEHTVAVAVQPSPLFRKNEQTSAYVSNIRQHTSAAYVSIRQHTSAAYVSTRWQLQGGRLLHFESERHFVRSHGRLRRCLHSPPRLRASHCAAFQRKQAAFFVQGPPPLQPRGERGCAGSEDAFGSQGSLLQ